MAYFLAVAEERSFTRAADRCHVAQPSLSRQIHAMERALGARLFDRLPRDVRITAAGELFAREAAKALEHSRRGVSLVKALEREKSRNLRIGLSSLCDLPRVRGVIDAVQKSPNRAALECVMATSAELSLALVRGELDLAVVDVPVRRSGLTIVSIYKEPLVVALPQRHPLAQRPIARLFELKHQQICLISNRADPAAGAIEAMLQRGGVSSVAWTMNLLDLLGTVANGQLVGMLRSSATRMRRDGVVYKQLIDSIQLETAISGRKDDHRQSVLSFRDALIAFAQRPSSALVSALGRPGILSAATQVSRPMPPVGGAPELHRIHLK